MTYKLIFSDYRPKGTCCIYVKEKDQWLTKELKIRAPNYRDPHYEEKEIKLFYYNSIRYAIQTIKKFDPTVKNSQIIYN